MPRWLITGGCGFIGTNLIHALSVAGSHSIRVVDNLSVGTRDDFARVADFQEAAPDTLDWNRPNPQLIVGDILDESLALSAANGAEIIVHLAGNTGVGPSVEDPRQDCLNNVIGTLNYLEAARANGVKRFVLASSGAPVGEATPPVHENQVCRPVSPYGASKLACEGYCSAYARTFGVDTVALRFSNVYGPGSIHKNSVVASFTKRALAGEALVIFGDGAQTRDFLYIDDLIDAIIKASTRDGIGGEIFQIATNSENSVAALADLLAGVLKDKALGAVQVNNQPVRRGDVLRNFADTSKARRMLGWTPTTDLNEGLSKTVSYFLELNGRHH